MPFAKLIRKYKPSKRRATASTVGAALKKRPRRTYKKSAKPRLTAGTVYRYTRFSDVEQVIPSTAYGAEYGYTPTYTLDKVKAYTDFVSLYDQFKITGVQVRVQMVANPNAILAPGIPTGTNINAVTSVVNGENFYPKLWYIEDSDDSGTLSLSALRERQGVKCLVLKPNTELKFYVRPKVLV